MLMILFIDVDECSPSTDDCHENASCINTNGSFSCKCNFGFFGDGKFCSGSYNSRGKISTQYDNDKYSHNFVKAQ